MKIFEELNEKIKRLTIWDISILKIGLLVLGMIVGAHFDYFIKENLMTFLLVFLVCWFYLGIILPVLYQLQTE